MAEIITRINEKHVDENGILQIRVIENVHIDLESLKEDHMADFELTGHKEVLALSMPGLFLPLQKKPGIMSIAE